MQTQRPPRLLTPFLTLGLLLAVASSAWGQRGIDYLAQIQGEVYIQQNRTSQRASSGKLVRTEQTIEVKPNGQVTLVCSNHTRHLLHPGTYAVRDYCPAAPARNRSSRSQTTRGGWLRNGTRGTFDAAQPYVLSPRHTALLSPDQVLLQWHPVDQARGADQTQVTVRGFGVNWTIATSLGQIPYDGSSPLLPNYTYTITVEQGGKVSRANFVVLPPEERDRVNAEVAQVQALGLDPDGAAIGTALVYLNYQNPDPDYRSYALNLDALGVLQARIQAGTSNTQIYLLQAEAYLAMDLPLEARQSLERSLELAQANDEPEAIAQSYRDLGQIAARQTEYAAARQFFQDALALYTDLEDGEQIKEIQQALAGLETQENRNE